MNKRMLLATLIAGTASLAVNAQQSTTTTSTHTAVFAKANGDDSYLRFSNNTYKDNKKYVIVKFWSESSPLTETEKEELAYLKKHLTKRNIEVIDFQWKTEEDLKAALTKYNLEVEVLAEKRIHIKNKNFKLNTTSGKALLVMEDEKPYSLCSGKDCESHLKTYFKLQAYN